jgi:hypothetical protein
MVSKEPHLMLNPIRRAGAFALLALSLAAACSSEHAAPTTPSLAPTAASASLLGAVGSVVGSTLSVLQLVQPLQRTTPLPNDITVTQTIDGSGGTLSIPAAGVTVTVPQGALATPTVITMRARAGAAVAYDFEPHGIVFAGPLTFTQKLGDTNASLLSFTGMQLGYYADDSLLGQNTALVSELIGGTVSLLSQTFTSRIQHFSGYVVSCGRGQ